MQVHHLQEGAFLVESEQGSVLLGCPPEMIKLIQQKKLTVPDTIVLSDRLYAGNSSQTAIEFFLYHFMFIQQGLAEGRKLRIFVSERQIKKLTEMLRVTLLGPTLQEMLESGQSEEWSQQLIKESTHLAVKNKAGKIYQIDDLIDWNVLEVGEELELRPQGTTIASESINIRRVAGTGFQCISGSEIIDIDLTVSGVQAPCYPVEHQAVNFNQQHATVTILGSSDGFDPIYGSNGSLFNFNGQLGLWDCPPYLNQHLTSLGIELSQIEAMIISHVHDDHVDVVESLCYETPLNVYCTAEIYFSMIVKLAAILDCDLKEASQYHNWHIVSVGEPFCALGAEFTLFYSVHSIPSLGCRVMVPDDNGSKKILISGDHLPFNGLEDMRKKGVLSEERFHDSTHLIEGDEDIILIDAGGGLIHGDYLDYMRVKEHIYFYHTSKIDESTLGDSKQLVKSGQVLI